jgi:hypothetical protein
MKISINKIKELHKGHFFSQGSVNFFKSRFARFANKDINGDYLFITSEQTDFNSPRKYTVRRCDSEGNITNESFFMQFSSLHEAKKRVKFVLENTI